MRRLLISVALLGMIDVVSAAPATQPGGVDAAALVREVRQAESWVDQAKSLHLKLDCKIDYSPATAAKNHTETAVDESIEMAFDDHRVYRSEERDLNGLVPYSSYQIWDGRLFTSFGLTGGKFTPPDMTYQPSMTYGLGDNPDVLVETFISTLPWLRAATHHFWFSLESPQSQMRFPDEPEKFSLVGRDDFHGHDCFQLQSDSGKRHTYYVGVEDHRLYGINTINFSTDFYGDYKEIAPGRWMPMSIGYTFDPAVSGGTNIQMTVTLAEVDQPLPEALFKPEIPDGVTLYDRRYWPPIRYVYRKEMPAAEIDKLVAEAREKWQEGLLRTSSSYANLDKPAAPLVRGKWLNSPPLSWADLKGKVVLVGFWAEWVPASVGGLMTLNDYAQQPDAGVAVISVHLPGSSVELIQAQLAKNSIRLPVYVDIPPLDSMLLQQVTGNPRLMVRYPDAWGYLCDQFGVRTVPDVFVVDQTGKIVAHGSASQMIGKAASLTSQVMPGAR